MLKLFKNTPVEDQQVEMVQLVGVDPHRMLERTVAFQSRAKTRLMQIESEIARLTQEHANTLLVLDAGESSLAVLRAALGDLPIEDVPTIPLIGNTGDGE